MGKHSGRHAFRKKLEELGYTLEAAALDEAFVAFKALADKKKDIYDEDLVALIDEEAREKDRIRVVSLQVIAGTKGPQTAELELEIDGVVRAHKATGDGPVDATFKAIRALVPNTATLQLYQVHAVTQGTDAQAEVTVRLYEDGKSVNGLGADTDTLVASAKAYVNALNKLLVKRQKRAPEALSA
jgi:2-isopropylmalate synthase